MPKKKYSAAGTRYDGLEYRRCGRSGLRLPAVSLGLWHNFGHVDNFSQSRSMVCYAFDRGITHFDLANNYGPPPGSAEENFGKILANNLRSYRDEIIISTKAGYTMWPGPYGDFGSRKYLLASLNASLRRMKLEYVDIFYHHRPDPETPLEESMGALSQAIISGKALYAGISNYKPEDARKAIAILKDMGVHCLIHQPSYSMLNRWVEDGLLAALESEGVGCIAFSPLSQGLLTNKYLHGIPRGSRASKPHTFLKKERLTPELLKKVEQLDALAQARGQTLAQMALAWILKDKRITSVLAGASSAKQVQENIEATKNTNFTGEELSAINRILA